MDFTVLFVSDPLSKEWHLSSMSNEVSLAAACVPEGSRESLHQERKKERKKNYASSKKLLTSIMEKGPLGNFPSMS